MVQWKKAVVGPFQKQGLYISTAVLWLSGTMWLYFRYCRQSQGEFGPQSHPAQAMLLKLHGAAAMAFLMVFGALLYHIQPGWKDKLQRLSGLPLLVLCGLLILTGWGLYYVGDDTLRNLTSIIHSILGLLLPVIISLHVWRIVRRRARLKN